MAARRHPPELRSDLRSESSRQRPLHGEVAARAESAREPTQPPRPDAPERLSARDSQEHAALIDQLGHDVRGVLGAADGFAQLLELRLAGPLSAEQERDIARIRALLRTATDLVDDIVHAA
jgi:signal transduction histidine kinase